MSFLRSNALARLQTAREAFDAASPFPHLVLDDLLEPSALASLLDCYPPAEWTGWDRFTDTYQAGKRYCQDIAAMPTPLAELIGELCRPPFLEALSAATGIDALIPDPYLEGGGLHSSGPAGVLAPHTDFHTYTRLGLYRQLNLLLYLNREWSEDDGGSLGFWRKGEDQPSKIVVPTLGRVVLFRTDDRSVHGFTTPVAPGRERRSVALYYYTAAESGQFSGDTTTYWQSHDAPTAWKRLRLLVYKVLLFIARGFAMLAHRANPTRTRRPRRR